MTRKFQFVVYKITFPNGKIYIGKDIGKEGHTIRYFGSWDYAHVEDAERGYNRTPKFRP